MAGEEKASRSDPKSAWPNDLDGTESRKPREESARR